MKDNLFSILVMAVLFLTGLAASPLQGEEPVKQHEDAKSPGVFDLLLDTAAKTAEQVDRVGLEITRMSDAEECALGAEINKEVLRHTPAVKDAGMQQRVAKLAAPLIEQRRRRGINYTIQVVDSEVVNAYSVAGGYVYITGAFLKEFPGDAAVAMALGHEIGHVDLKHCVEKVQYQAAGRKVVGDDVSALAQVAYSTLRSAYTKEQEFEADEYGFKVACQAGSKPNELLEFIRALSAYENRQSTNSIPGVQDESGMGQKLSEYLATHPPGADRVKRLERQAAGQAATP